VNEKITNLLREQKETISFHTSLAPCKISIEFDKGGIATVKALCHSCGLAVHRRLAWFGGDESPTPIERQYVVTHVASTTLVFGWCNYARRRRDAVEALYAIGPPYGLDKGQGNNS